MEPPLKSENKKAQIIGNTAISSPARTSGVFLTKKITKRLALNKPRKIIRKTAPNPLALRLPSVTKVEK